MYHTFPREASHRFYSSFQPNLYKHLKNSDNIFDTDRLKTWKTIGPFKGDKVSGDLNKTQLT